MIHLFCNTQKRKTWKLGNCLSTKTTPEIVSFDAAGLLGGIIHEGKKPGGLELQADEVSAKQFGPNILALTDQFLLGDEFERKTITSICFPLYSIILALGNPTIHYFR